MINLDLDADFKKYFQCFKFKLSFWKNVLSNVCLGFGTYESLGSSSVKMSQAFHDPSICFNFLYFHQKVNTFETPEMCLYLDSDIWAGCFAIIFAGSFYHFKPVSCWILFCENVTDIPEPFNQLPSRVRKALGKHPWVNMFKTPEMRLYFNSDVWGRGLAIIFVGSFPYFKFLTKTNSQVRRK